MQAYNGPPCPVGEAERFLWVVKGSDDCCEWRLYEPVV